MARITIIGGGQSGLQLGIGLLQTGYDVTIVSDRTPEQIHDGRVTSSQCMFATALDHERALGIDFWDDTCPPVEGIASPSRTRRSPARRRSTGAPASTASRCRSTSGSSSRAGWRTSRSGGSSSSGGRRRRPRAVRGGERPRRRRRRQRRHHEALRARRRASQFDQPMRALALTYVTGMTPRPEFSAVCFNIIPGVGEYFVFPALTTSGPCEIMVFEGVPGGPMDCWGDGRRRRSTWRRANGFAG